MTGRQIATYAAANAALLLVLSLGIWFGIAILVWFAAAFIWLMLLAYAVVYFAPESKFHERPPVPLFGLILDLIVLGLLLWQRWYLTAGAYIASIVLLEAIFERSRKGAL